MEFLREDKYDGKNLIFPVNTYFSFFFNYDARYLLSILIKQDSNVLFICVHLRASAVSYFFKQHGYAMV